MDMWNLAADLGLAVVERRGQHRSGYRPSEHLVRITPGLRGRVLRSVLAHEIAHHVLGHLPTEFGPVEGRQEREANEWAARRLISLDAYREVEHLRDAHVPSMAFDLNVTDELVAAFQRTLLRVGDTVYVSPKMGAGEFTARVEVA